MPGAPVTPVRGRSRPSSSGAIAQPERPRASNRTRDHSRSSTHVKQVMTFATPSTLIRVALAVRAAAVLLALWAPAALAQAQPSRPALEQGTQADAGAVPALTLTEVLQRAGVQHPLVE